jgi:1-acyl-sn-glycerol-3-phosphate acyltransferase
MAEEREGADAPRVDEIGVEKDDEAIDELRLALHELGAEIRSRFPVRGVRVPLSQRVGWEDLFGAARRRLGTLGMVERSGEVDEFGMEDVAVRRIRPLLDFLFDHYWRVELSGLENVPETGPCLLVANRSGLLPYDGLMLSHGIEREHPSGQRPRFLVADWLMHLPFVHATVAQIGGVRACRENAERLLASKHFVVVFPEGVKGAAKVFRERYQLKRFGRGGVVRIALESGAPLVPVGIVGAEEVHPILFKVGASARTLGLPFLPVTPTFPLLGPLGFLPLPSKWMIRVGEPIAMDHLESEVASDELLVSRLNEDMRSKIQNLVDAALSDRESIWG